jgi:hypothetical protein
MAVIGGLAPTYVDHARRMDPDGKIARIINILSQTNDILKDMVVVEGNLPTGHQTTVRTGLPSATWRLLNAGVAPTKSTTAQITDTAGMLETYSDIDVDLAKLNGNTAEFRLSEDMAFLEGMNQQMASAYFYSNAMATPQQIMGFAPRFSTVNTAVAQSANNVIDAGGTGSTNTSMWIAAWGNDTCHGFFPKGSVAGLQHRDLGEVTAPANGGTWGTTLTQLQVYRSHFQWKTGLSVRDWRYVVRIANIDVTQMLTGNAPNLLNGLIRGLGKIPTLPAGSGPVQQTDAPDGGQAGAGRPAIYVNRVIRTYLDIQATNKTNVLLQMGEYAGQVVTMFRGIPVRTVDALLNTEARVV